MVNRRDESDKALTTRLTLFGLPLSHKLMSITAAGLELVWASFSITTCDALYPLSSSQPSRNYYSELPSLSQSCLALKESLLT